MKACRILGSRPLGFKQSLASRTGAHKIRSRNSSAAPDGCFLACALRSSGLYQVFAKRGFHLVVIADGRGDQIEFENSFHLGIPFALPAIYIPLLGPETEARDQIVLTREFLDEQFIQRLVTMKTHPKVGDLALVKMFETGYKRTGDIQPARISAEANAGVTLQLYAKRLYLPEWRREVIEKLQHDERNTSEVEVPNGSALPPGQ